MIHCRGWALNDDHTGFFPRLRGFLPFILGKQMTYGDETLRFERLMAAFVGVKYAVFCSSGSTANTILAMWARTNWFVNNAENYVIFPSLTWATSVSPFVMCGFQPLFVNVTRKNLSADCSAIRHLLLKDSPYKGKIRGVFITSLLGMCPDINEIFTIKAARPDLFWGMDNCESLATEYCGINLSNLGMPSTTSTYYGHLLQSVEGGFVFTNDAELAKFAIMARNHGMIRQLPDDWKPTVNPKDHYSESFYFHIIGNNFRNSDIHARIGILNFKKLDRETRHRRTLYAYFYDRMVDCGAAHRFHLFEKNPSNVLHGLPLIIQPDIPEAIAVMRRDKLIAQLNAHRIRWRPVISGNLLRHRAFQRIPTAYYHGDKANFADWVHRYGLYVGLHGGVSKSDIDCLVKICKNI